MYVAGLCLPLVFSLVYGGKGASIPRKVYRRIFTSWRIYIWMLQDGDNDPRNAGWGIGGALERERDKRIKTRTTLMAREESVFFFEMLKLLVIQKDG